MSGRRAPAAVALTAALLLSGCVMLPWTSPSPSASPTTTCEGDQSRSLVTLNLNATPPREFNGVRLYPNALEQDDKGLVASVMVNDGDESWSENDLRVGSKVDLRGHGTLVVRHLCMVRNLPSPMPPGTSRGSIGLG